MGLFGLNAKQNGVEHKKTENDGEQVSEVK